jgi:hypothetical protein
VHKKDARERCQCNRTHLQLKTLKSIDGATKKNGQNQHHRFFSRATLRLGGLAQVFFMGLIQKQSFNFLSNKIAGRLTMIDVSD